MAGTRDWVVLMHRTHQRVNTLKPPGEEIPLLSLVDVREHLRGQTKFAWNGLTCEVIPPKYSVANYQLIFGDRGTMFIDFKSHTVVVQDILKRSTATYDKFVPGDMTYDPQNPGVAWEDLGPLPE